MGRTHIGARPAFETIIQMVLLRHDLVLFFASQSTHAGRIQEHGARIDAMAAADAGVDLLLDGRLLVLSKDDDAGCSLGDGNVQARNGLTHHGATEENPRGILRHTDLVQGIS